MWPKGGAEVPDGAAILRPQRLPVRATLLDLGAIPRAPLSKGFPVNLTGSRRCVGFVGFRANFLSTVKFAHQAHVRISGVDGAALHTPETQIVFLHQSRKDTTILTSVCPATRSGTRNRRSMFFLVCSFACRTNSACCPCLMADFRAVS